VLLVRILNYNFLHESRLNTVAKSSQDCRKTYRSMEWCSTLFQNTKPSSWAGWCLGAVHGCIMLDQTFPTPCSSLPNRKKLWLDHEGSGCKNMFYVPMHRSYTISYHATPVYGVYGQDPSCISGAISGVTINAN